MLNRLRTTDRMRLGLNLLLGLLALVLCWMLVDRAFLSSPSVGLSLEPLRPSGRVPGLTWFPDDSAPESRTQVVVEDEDLTAASINAKLLGVVIHPGGSYAAIQTPQVPDGLYRLGDEIANEVELVAIEPHRVIVSERGFNRQIELKSLAEDGGTAEAERVDSGGELQGFNLSGVLGATPIEVSGHGLAVRLDSVDAEVADMSGLQPRDVVLSVGGRSVAELVANPGLWQQFMQETLVPVRLQRDGEELEIQVNARSLGERILPQIGQGLLQ